MVGVLLAFAAKLLSKLEKYRRPFLKRMFEIVNILVSRKAQKKWSGYTATPESRAYLFGVERRCRLTDTFLPLLTVLVYGLTGTIFFPALVFAINLCNLKTCNVQALPLAHTSTSAKTNTANLRDFSIFNFLKNVKDVANSKIRRIFAATNFFEGNVAQTHIGRFLMPLFMFRLKRITRPCVHVIMAYTICPQRKLVSRSARFFTLYSFNLIF